MLKTILYRSIVWLLLCFLSRILFLIFHHQQLAIYDILATFWYGLRLDFSILGYLLVFTVFLGFFPFSSVTKFSKWVFAFLLFVQLYFGVIDIGLYQDWGHTVNYQFLQYLKHPLTAMGNLSWKLHFLILLSTVVSGIVAIYLGIKKHPAMPLIGIYKLWSVLGKVFLIGLGVLLSRGGIQVAPINQSFAFFSKHIDANYAALNSTWNLVFTIFNGQEDQNIADYQVQNAPNLEAIYSHQFNKQQPISTVVISPNVNIVIVMLESFTAHLVGYTGAKENYTPQLNKIAKEGIAFTNAYCTGNRTDKGLAAVVSGFPAQANSSIITIPSKAQKLPSIFKALPDYQSTFYYGGEPEFANMKSYLFNAGIDQMVSGFNFPMSAYRGKWGVPDQILFAKLEKDLKSATKPFIKLVLTLSSHEPFDYPNNPSNLSADLQFKASIKYTDSCLGVFWNNVKTIPNTLFIFVADHGRGFGNKELAQVPWANKIPLIVAGTALQDTWKGKLITHLVNQHHLPSNLLGMLGKKHTSQGFLFQQSWFREGNAAYYTYFNGVGMLKGNQYQNFDNVTKLYFPSPNANTQDSLAYKARIYQHKVMEAFNQW